MSFNTGAKLKVLSAAEHWAISAKKKKKKLSIIWL